VRRFPKELRVFRAYCDRPFHQGLDKILKSQRKLEEFSYEKPQGSWELYEVPIKSCCETLRKVHLYFTSAPIDLEAFAYCTGLQSLLLCNQQSPVEDKPDLLNFNKLPTTLEKLRIERYSVTSSQMAHFENLQRLKSIELLFLSVSGTHCGNTGITSETIVAIANIRPLEELFIEEYWSAHTDLSGMADSLNQVNSIPNGHETILKYGIRRYGVALASSTTLTEWQARMAPYVRAGRFRQFHEKP